MHDPPRKPSSSHGIKHHRYEDRHSQRRKGHDRVEVEVQTKADKKSRHKRDRSRRPSKSEDGGKDNAESSETKKTGVMARLGAAGQVSQSHEKAPVVSVSAFEDGQDFMAFPPSPSSPPPERQREKTKALFSREWDRGKEVHAGGMVFDFNEMVDPRSRKHGFRSSRKAPWVTYVDWERFESVPKMLHREVEAFLDYVSPTPREDELRGLVVKLVSRAIANTFPDATVHPFGSFATKLYLPFGDIDLVISSKVMAKSRKDDILHHLANAVKRAGLASKVSIIAKAKVPIIKFVTTKEYGRFNVDMSVNQPNGTVAADVINGFLNNWGQDKGGGKALRSLIMITKAFLAQRGLNEVFTGGLGSYAIVCLAINFLQLHPKIRRAEIDPERNLGVLLMDFFELYGWYFNYEKTGIIIRKGGGYFGKAERGWADFDRRKQGLLSVEDPLDLSNDISRGSYNFFKVQQTFRGAFDIMTSSAYAQASIIRARRTGRSSNMRTPEEISILSKIVGIAQETIDHRLLLSEIYKNGTLHKAVGNLEHRNGFTRAPPGPSLHEENQELGEADMEPCSEDEFVGAKRRHKEDEEGGEDSGRYDIGDRRASSRKKLKKSGDGTNLVRSIHSPAVFTTDDEDAEGSINGSEFERYDIDWDLDWGGGEDEQDGEVRAKSDRRRNYWLSKGLGSFQQDSLLYSSA